MSPLAASGSRGYADYQRLENWDSGVLWSGNRVNAVASINSGVLDVGRYAYLAGFMFESQSMALVSCQWSLDSAGLVSAGFRSFVLSSQMGGNAQLRIPNLGPFVKVTVSAILGNSSTCTVQIFGTNRFHPLEFIPSSPVIVSQFGVALGANAQVSVFPSDYFTGPARMFAFAGQGFQVSPQWLNSAGVWSQIDSFIGAQNANLSNNLLLPPGAWRLGVANLTATATTFNLSVLPSMTGST